jgi:hypothetical protein
MGLFFLSAMGALKYSKAMSSQPLDVHLAGILHWLPSAAQQSCC